MIYNSVLGPSAPELGWVPAPRYLLRRDRIRRLLKNLPTGRLLEIGPGAGALLVEFANMGFQCESIERSSEARNLAKAFINKFGASVSLSETSGADWTNSFDIVCAFDVLEHIENDQEALDQWCSWLKPGGIILLSVPAHMKSWNTRDEWAGHYRRYEKVDFSELLEKKNLSIDAFECYGFPLANLAEEVAAKIYRSSAFARDNATNEERQRGTDLSGVDRRAELKFLPFLKTLPGQFAISFFVQMQRIFLKMDWGNGYIIKAIKR